MTEAYPLCGICNRGRLIPVHMGKGPDRLIRYRCTNPECVTRFDESGYEVFNAEKEEWRRISEG
jgi:hypothetical protein